MIDTVFLFLILVAALFVLNGVGILLLRGFISAWCNDPSALALAGSPPSGPPFTWGFKASWSVLRAYFLLGFSAAVAGTTRNKARQLMVIVILTAITFALAFLAFMKLRS